MKKDNCQSSLNLLDGGKMGTELPKTYYTMSGDVSIAYQVWGDGPIDIVLVPPIINHLEHLFELEEYVQFMRRLSSFARVIAFDKRGQGMSDYPGAGENSLETRMDDVRAVMDASNSDKASIFGCSEGGPISLMFTASHPERVNSLILYGTFAKFVRSDEYPSAPFDQNMFDGMVPMLMNKWGTGVSAGFLAPEFASKPEKLEWLGKLERLSNTPRGFKSVLELNYEINVNSLLKVINVPTLILHKVMDTGVSIVTSYDTALFFDSCSCFLNLPLENPTISWIILSRRSTCRMICIAVGIFYI